MRVAQSWLTEILQRATPDWEVTPEELDAGFVRVGLEVEELDTLEAIDGPLVVGKVVSITELTEFKKPIRFCQVEVGEPEPRGIVCGARNFNEGDLVVVALPGAVLPGGFEIATRKTYGQVSDGMICSVSELGIGKDHSGILVLEPGTAEPGADGNELLGLGDTIIELNITPDRGYCFSVRGLTRELACGFDLEYADPASVPAHPAEGEAWPVRLEPESKASRFVMRKITGIDPQAVSPWWLQRRLLLSGVRPISPAVDVTNYVMLESGQPLHAYDADTLSGAIVVRQARPGETLVTLDDASRELVADDMLITDESGPIGLAGVMGGQTTEVTEQTTSIVLEAAHFDPLAIGRTYRRHKLPSEASRRFERGVDVAVQYAAARKAADLLVRFGGGSLAEGETVVGQAPPMPQQHITADLPARILGTAVSREQVIEILTTSGIKVTQLGDSLTLVPPTWRPDLVDPYDYVEEVGRKIGFDQIESILPTAPAGRGLSPAQQGRRTVRRAIADLGFVELISLPFISRDEVEQITHEDDPRRNLVQLANPLDDTHGCLRSTLLPGLFQAIKRNTSRSNDDLALFEMGTIFGSGRGVAAPRPSVLDRPSDEELAGLEAALPEQATAVAGVVSGNWLPAGWQGPAVRADWTHVVALAEEAARAVGITLTRKQAQVMPWHPGRCVELFANDRSIGVAGELHPSVVKQLGLPERTCAVEFDLGFLLEEAPGIGSIPSLSSFPLAKEDVALVVDESVPAEDLRRALVEGAGELLESCELFDIYRGPQIGEGKKSLAYSLHFRGADKTLKDTESAAARDAAVAVAAERFGALQRA